MPEIQNAKVRWIRWIARSSGLLLLALVISIAIGEGLAGEPLPTLRTMSLQEMLLWAAMAVMVLGTVVAWRWEGVGGAMTVGGALLFTAVNSIASGYLRINWVILVFTMIGLLFMACWWRMSEEG